MNREIKFRARIKENGIKKMFYQDTQYLISFLRRVSSFLYFEKDDKEEVVDDFNGGVHESRLSDDIENYLDRYTGLKDKNGKEIYEGDIVLYPTTESEYVDVGVGDVKVAEQQVNSFYPVEFFEGEFGMNIKQTDESIYKGWNSLKEIKSCVSYFEIIGNIYESPELLTP